MTITYNLPAIYTKEDAYHLMDIFLDKLKEHSGKIIPYAYKKWNDSKDKMLFLLEINKEGIKEDIRGDIVINNKSIVINEKSDKVKDMLSEDLESMINQELSELFVQ